MGLLVAGGTKTLNLIRRELLIIRFDHCKNVLLRRLEHSKDYLQEIQSSS